MSADGSISPEEWNYLVDNDEALTKEFEKVFDNPDFSDNDDFSPDNFDGCVNMDIVMDRSGEEPQLAKILNQMKDNEGNSIEMDNKNLILDTRVNEIEFQYGFLQTVDIKLIAENLFAHVNQEKRRHKLINIIINVRKINKSLKDKDIFNIFSNGTKQRKATTQVK